LFLDLFGHFGGDAQAYRDILGDMVAADGQDHGVPDVAVDVDGEVSGAATDIADADAHLALGLVEDDLGRGEWVEDELGGLDVGGRDALAQVFDSGFGSGDDVGFDFQAVTEHADRRVDAFLTVEIEAALDDVDDLAVVGDGHGARLVNGLVDILLLDDATGNTDDTAGVDRGDVRTGQADEGGGDLQTGGALGFFHRARDGLRGRRQIDDSTFTDPL
jgi:hypothetical protein